MRHDIIMPALGMAQDTGTLLAWHKSEGEAVTQGETLFEVETDKTTMEVEAPASGFLVGISASDGDEVPVGQVIAIISDSADAPTPKPESAAAPQGSDETSGEDTLPPGKPIIMPVLGMSQDTGVLVGWSKELGDTVHQDDILFEVETDKSVVEVPAGIKGYLVARLAAAGDDVPTGETIAIISDEPSKQMVNRAYSTSAAPAEQSVKPTDEEKPKPVAEPAARVDQPQRKQTVTAPGGKVLASPKLKRMAHQAGYDLSLLAATDLPQPYHARDFEALKHASESAGKRAVGSPSIGAIHTLSARLSGLEFEAFLGWAADHLDSSAGDHVIAAFAGASLADKAVVRVDRRGESTTYSTQQQLSQTVESDDKPDLILHDLRGTFISSAEFPPDRAPVIAIVGSEGDVTLTLTCMDDQLTGKDAAVLLNNFAGRVADPLRHIF
ncbi:biotin/lipoyl-containing protein [Saccharospirillum impatiens]|uniref:biotin/lipoyl-containing protein n=1 Tax=Saccharospirillum impatiens TaxID=169438 RepID=UPI000423B2ED|nr:biotin/lipoyl-containing protein [Saccharospirillum impatiens]